MFSEQTDDWMNKEEKKIGSGGGGRRAESATWEGMCTDQTVCMLSNTFLSL